MSDIFDELVTDRASGQTYYNVEDLNRVEDAVKELSKIMSKEGYYSTPKSKEPTYLPDIVNPGNKRYTLPYLKSSGTQYIDTGFKPNNNTRAIMKYVVLSSGNRPTQALFGGRIADGNAMFEMFIINNSYFRPGYGAKNTLQITGTSDKLVLIDMNKETTTINGTSVSYSSETFQSNYNLTLFGVNNGGTVEAATMATAKLYSCQIYDNGTLIRDYIPTKDDNDVACLYDKVNEQYYYNAGTGTFEYGEESYTQVEYLESSGTQYINTGFNPNYNTRVVLDADILNNNGFLLGSRHSSSANSTSNNFAITYSSTTKVRTDFGGNEGYITVSSVLGRHIIDKNKKVTTYGGVSYTSTPVNATFQSNYPLYLLTVNTAGTIRSDGISAKIYSCQIYDNDVLVRDYVPVKDGTGERYLYDLVNGMPYSFEHSSTSLATVKIASVADLSTTAKTKIDAVKFTELSAKAIKLGSATGEIINGEYILKSNGLSGDYMTLKLSGNFKYDATVVPDFKGTNSLLVTSFCYSSDKTTLYVGVGTQSTSAAELTIGDITLIPNGTQNGDKAEITISGAGVEKTTLEVGRVGGEIGSEDEGLPDFSYGVDPNIWNVYDFPTDKEMARYLNNLITIRRQLARYEISLPSTMEGLTYVGANEIEELLVKINELVKKMKTQYRLCNTFKCGEGRFYD